MALDPDAVLWRTTSDDQPLLVLLHGVGSHERDLFALVPDLPPHLNVASLRAPRPWPHGGNAWFDLAIAPDGTISYDAAQVDEAGTCVSAWLREQSQRFPALGLLGFSQGAATALRAALVAPEPVECLVLLSGLLPVAPEATGPATLPTFVAIGDHDDVIGPRSGALEAWARTQLDATVRHYPIGHWVSAPELADVREFLAEHLGPRD